MKLVYTSDKQVEILVMLNNYEILGYFCGPAVFKVPVMPGNNEYDNIISRGITIEEYTPPPPRVPDSVTPLQARKILRLLGYIDQLDALMEEATPDVRDAWEYATQIERQNPLILEFAAELELDEDDVDLLFIEASKL